jgi:hypothetical protein
MHDRDVIFIAGHIDPTDWWPGRFGISFRQFHLAQGFASMCWCERGGSDRYLHLSPTSGATAAAWLEEFRSRRHSWHTNDVESLQWCIQALRESPQPESIPPLVEFFLKTPWRQAFHRGRTFYWLLDSNEVVHCFNRQPWGEFLDNHLSPEHDLFLQGIALYSAACQTQDGYSGSPYCVDSENHARELLIEGVEKLSRAGPDGATYLREQFGIPDRFSGESLIDLADDLLALASHTEGDIALSIGRRVEQDLWQAGLLSQRFEQLRGWRGVN